MESTIPSLPTPGPTVGALLVGGIISTVFYGILFGQTCVYFTRYPDDSIWLKGVVAAVGLAQTANVALFTHALWHYLVANAGDLSTIDTLVCEWKKVVPCYLDRASSLSMLPSILITRAITVPPFHHAVRLVQRLTRHSPKHSQTSLNSTGLGLIPGIRQESQIVRALVPSSFAITAGTDIMITVSLVYYLHFRKTRNEKTDSVVNKLIRMSVNNGLLSSTIAFAAFVCVVAWDAGFVTIALCALLGKAYGNSLLGSLNSRQAHREALAEHLRSRGALSEQRSGEALSRKGTLGKRSLSWAVQDRATMREVEGDAIELAGVRGSMQRPLSPILPRPLSPGVLVTKEVVQSWDTPGMPYYEGPLVPQRYKPLEAHVRSTDGSKV
ncbi:hypothetical protein HDZ31DRAFT_43409 [Schizophyllum fasciatum]